MDLQKHFSIFGEMVHNHTFNVLLSLIIFWNSALMVNGPNWLSRGQRLNWEVKDALKEVTSWDNCICWGDWRREGSWQKQHHCWLVGQSSQSLELQMTTMLLALKRSMISLLHPIHLKHQSPDTHQAHSSAIPSRPQWVIFMLLRDSMRKSCQESRFRTRRKHHGWEGRPRSLKPSEHWNGSGLDIWWEVMTKDGLGELMTGFQEHLKEA